jgi:mono/diheme cytochrome c family protein
LAEPKYIGREREINMLDLNRRLKLLMPAVLLALAGLSLSPTLRQASSATSSPHFQSAQSPPADAAREEFFEKRVRPLLAAKCYGCHTASQSGGLRLDSGAALLKGGDSGPAVVPGQPAASLLLQAVTHTHERLKMPKGGAKLADAEIADLTEWVRSGAYFPATGAPATGYELKPEHKRHWSFQPVAEARVPEVKDRNWPLNPVDNFVLAKLEAKGLAPNPPADRRTLLRRVTYGLTGLPPTPAEVDAFLADNSPDAYAKVVDRLLDSPRYGERWGRHWLDLARYSDTLGTQDFINGIQTWFPYSYTYRDWVIRALNDDLPYDQFLIQQMAADRLPGNNPRNLAALGFLTLGRGGLGVTGDERMDDKIDVVTRGTMGLTVNCARCHNHKFDPIPTKDYYALYSVFANSREPKELPLLDAQAANDPKAAELKAELHKVETATANYRRSRFPVLQAGYRTAEEIAKYLTAAHEARDLHKETELIKLQQEKDYNLYMLRRWRDYLKQCGERHDTVFAAWRALSALPEKEFAVRAPSILAALVNTADAGEKLHPLVAEAFKTAPASLAEAATVYGKLLASFDKPDRLANPDEEALRQILRGADSPTNVPFADYDSIRTVKDAAFEREQKGRIDKLVLKHAYENAPPRAMSLEDEDEIKPGYVFIRGNPNNKGDEAPRQFLLALAGENRQPFKQGSGRLELARAIANKDNPLTARVMVNRVWLHHFGRGIVATPSDFGTRGDFPTHPELLDYLARHFVENGWSLKKLHRLMLLSRAYQQSSADNAAARKVDPENLLLWRVNRRRLDFESLRDSLLAVGGNLDLTTGGTGVSATAWPFTHRRTVYSFIDRVSVPNDFRNFDFASPDGHSAQRYLTTVPQQALYLMNSPFVMEQAAAILKRPEVASAIEPRQRIRELYRAIYGRPASVEEIALGLQFIKQNAAAPAENSKLKLQDSKLPWLYGQGEYDEAARKVKSFTPHQYFVQGHWRISPIPGDPRYHSARLTEQGGAPGKEKQNAAIRRWVAPFDGKISISGALEHFYENACFDCDGVQAWAVSSRHGQLGHWTASISKAETKVESVEVKRGDTIDFVVDSRKNANGDEFKWPVTIRRLDASTAGGQMADSWDSVADFRRPGDKPLGAWERYAQVLLSAVEFMLID